MLLLLMKQLRRSQLGSRAVDVVLIVRVKLVNFLKNFYDPNNYKEFFRNLALHYKDKIFLKFTFHTKNSIILAI